MELRKVQSSNVEALEYLEADQVLLVRYKDGALYARPGVTAGQMEMLDAAPSVGSCLASLPGDAILIRKGGTRSNEQTQSQGGTGSAVLQSYQEDDCCGRAIFRFLNSPNSTGAIEWTCGKCGSTWRPSQKGALLHWSPTAPLFVVKVRG